MDEHPPTPAQRLDDKRIPPVTTRRLVLRPFAPADAVRVEAIINDDAIAAGTLTIPFPYPAGAALPWIEGHAASWAAGKSITWAVTRRPDDVVIGALSLRLIPAHHRGELGYWIARSEWGRGYATEALRGAIAFAFDELQLHRVDAHHFVENPASGRVMLKAGMTHEGRRRGAVFRAGVPRDLEEYAILRTDPRPSD